MKKIQRAIKTLKRGIDSFKATHPNLKKDKLEREWLEAMEMSLAALRTMEYYHENTDIQTKFKGFMKEAKG